MDNNKMLTTIMVMAVALLLLGSFTANALTTFFASASSVGCDVIVSNSFAQVKPISASSGSIGSPNILIGNNALNNAVYLPRDNGIGVYEHINTKSALLTPLVGNITVQLKKIGSPNGIVTADIKDSSNNTVYTFGSMNVTSLTSSFANYTFSNIIGYTPIINDSIGLEYAPIKQEYQITFDGTNDEITTNNHTIIPDNATIVSGVALVHPTGIYKLETIFGNLRNSLTEGFNWELTGSGTQEISLRSGIDGTAHIWTMNNLIPLEKDTFIGFTYDGSNKSVRFFQENSAETRYDNVTSDVNQGVQNFRIGHRQGAGGSAEYFHGSIDQLKMFNQTLSDNDFLNLYNGVSISKSPTMSFAFNEGSGSYTIDSVGSINGTLTNGASFSKNTGNNWVLVGINSGKLPTFDLTDIQNTDSKLVKSAWIVNWKNHDSFLTDALLTDLKNEGYTELIVTEIDENFSSSGILYHDLINWISDAHAMGFKVAGASFEQASWVNSTAFNDSQITTLVNTIYTKTHTYFDYYVSDIEPEALSDFATNKDAYMIRYHDVIGNITSILHGHNSTLIDWINNTRHPDLIHAGYSHGINDLPSDASQVATYYYLNSTARVGFKTVMDADSTSHKLIDATNLRFPARNLGNMPADEYKRLFITIDNFNKTHNDVIGISNYFYGYEDFGLAGVRTSLIGKTPNNLIKYTNELLYTGQLKDNSYFVDTMRGNEFLKYDTYMYIPTIGNQSNLYPSYSIDNNTNTFYESRSSDTSVNIIYSMNQTFTIQKLVMNLQFGHIPTSLKVYVSNNDTNFGVARLSFTPLDATGNQTINIPRSSGQYVKIAINSNSYKPSIRINEITMFIPILDADSTTPVSECNGSFALYGIIGIISVASIGLVLLRENIIEGIRR